MTKDEQEVIRTARAWWKSHRPTGWGFKEHSARPLINMARGGATYRLARAVNAMLIAQIEMDKILKIKTLQIKGIKLPKRIMEPDIKQLTTSILKFGQMEPILLDDKFNLLDGYSRIKVLKSLGHQTVRCLIRSNDEIVTNLDDL